MSRQEYTALGGSDSAAADGDAIEFGVNQVKERAIEAWKSATAEAKPWGEFFAFGKMGVPYANEIESWATANFHEYLANFKVIIYILYVLCVILSPVGTIIFGAFLYFSNRLAWKEGGNTGVNVIAKIFMVLSILYFGSHIIPAVAFITMVMVIRCCLFHPEEVTV